MHFAIVRPLSIFSVAFLHFPEDQELGAVLNLNLTTACLLKCPFYEQDSRDQGF